MRSFIERPEPVHVEAFVVQPPVEALDMAVRHRTARLDMHQFDLALLRPGQHPAPAELRPVVPPHTLRPAALFDL